MVGGYNVQSLIDLLKSKDALLASEAATALSKTLLVFDAFHDVLTLSEVNPYAKQVIDSWSAAEWFIGRPKVPEAITVTVFKVPGETNTDDLSPAPLATTRPDIPLHATVMLESRMPGGIETIAQLKEKGHPVAYVGDVVGRVHPANPRLTPYCGTLATIFPVCRISGLGDIFWEVRSRLSSSTPLKTPVPYPSSVMSQRWKRAW
jgi:aconitase B